MDLCHYEDVRNGICNSGEFLLVKVGNFTLHFWVILSYNKQTNLIHKGNGLNIVARYCLFEITGVYVVFLGIVSTILCGIAACVLEKRFSTSTLHILFFGILFYLLLFYIGYELQLFLEKEIYEFNRNGNSLPFYWVFIPEFLLYEITALIAFFGRLIYLIRKLRT